jgi:spermidine synthase
VRFTAPAFIFSLAVCCLGLSAFLTQLTLMREFVSGFSGNELVFGIVLGNWMLLTGIGSTLGKTASRLRSPIVAFLIAQFLIALLPIADVFLLRWLRNVVFLTGVEVGVTETVASCFLLLAPYCLVTGYALTTACQIAATAFRRPELADSAAVEIGRVYLLDNLGNVFGGIAFLAVFAYLLSHFGMLYVAGCLNLLAAGIVAMTVGRRLFAAAAFVALVAILGVAASLDLDSISLRLEYAGQNVVFHGESPYGSLVATETAGQLNFIGNGVPLFSTHNTEQNEESVHYAMAQRPDAKRVLLISGGVSGTAREILKYPVEAVDYVELDPLILAAARRFLPNALSEKGSEEVVATESDESATSARQPPPSPSPRLHVINSDGRLFVRHTDRRYDVVIVNVPDPSTSQLNRFYTREFFAEVRRILTPDGALSFSLGSYENYLSPELARLIGIADRTLRTEFSNVLILPGSRVFFLASDGELTADVAHRVEQAGVKTLLVNRNYLKGTLTADRLADVRRAAAAAAGSPLNEDFNPILYFSHLRYWMRQFQVRFGLFEAVLVLLMLAYLVRLRPVPLVVFCGGFAASALEVVLLLAFQVLFGSLYYQVGLIVTMFMAGLVIGATLVGHWQVSWNRRHLAYLALAIAIFAALLPLALLGVKGVERFGQVAIPLLTLTLAILVGMQFPLAAGVDLERGRRKLSEESSTRREDSSRQLPPFPSPAATSGRLYTADYVGAALGALLVSTLLIPLLGVFAVCLATAGLNLVAAGVMFVSAARSSRQV